MATCKLCRRQFNRDKEGRSYSTLPDGRVVMLCPRHSLGETDAAIDQAWRAYEKKHPETAGRRS